MTAFIVAAAVFLAAFVVGSLIVMLPKIVAARTEVRVARAQHVSKNAEKSLNSKINKLIKEGQDLDKRIAELERYAYGDDIIDAARGTQRDTTTSR